MGLWILPFLDDNRDENKKRDKNGEIVKKRKRSLNQPHSRASSSNWIHLQQLALRISEMTFARNFSSVLRGLDDATNWIVASSASSAATSLNKLVDSAAALIDVSSSLLPTCDDIAKLADATFAATNPTLVGTNPGGGVNCEKVNGKRRRNSEEELLLKILWKE